MNRTPLRAMSSLVWPAFACSVFIACGGATESSDTGKAASMQVVSGGDQTGPVATELPAAVAIQVLDGAGKPVPSTLVNFVVTQGGGSVFAGAGMTNAQGETRERWTLGTAAGAQALEARVVDATTGQAVVLGRVTATAVPGPPATLTAEPLASTIMGQTVGVSAFGPVAKDAFQNVILGAAVTFDDGAVTVPAAERGDFAVHLRLDTIVTAAVLRVMPDLPHWRQAEIAADCLGGNSATIFPWPGDTVPMAGGNWGPNDPWGDQWMVPGEEVSPVNNHLSLNVDSVVGTTLWVSGGVGGRWERVRDYAYADASYEVVRALEVTSWDGETMAFSSGQTLHTLSATEVQGSGCHTAAPEAQWGDDGMWMHISLHP